MNTKEMSGASLITNGVISFLAGLALLFLTGISQSAIVVVFAAFAIILGLTQMIAASGEREEGKSVGYLTLLGFYSLAAGIGLLFFINSALSTVISLVAAYVIIAGIAEVVAAFVYRSEMGGYSWLVGSGLIRGIFGVFLLFNTGITLATFITYIAIYALLEGIVTSVFGYEIRKNVGRYHEHLMA